VLGLPSGGEYWGLKSVGDVARGLVSEAPPGDMLGESTGGLNDVGMGDMLALSGGL
jgi:hypothetical protein